MPIYIHKGDCTNFENENFIKFKITSDYDMSAWTFVVILGSIKKEITGLTDNEFTINYSSQETSSLNYGIQHFDVKVIDGNGCIKTISNTIPVIVTNKVVPPLQEAITLDVVSIEETTIEVIVGGGGGGTNNHAELENLDYENSGHTGFASSADLASKQDTLIAGDNITIVDNVISSTGGGSGTSDYTDLTNLPQINNVTLVGNTSLRELGIQPVGDYALNSAIPTQTSQLTNNSGFITNAVNDLANYYLKSEVYTQAEILDIINNFTSLKIEIVDALPTENISTSTFYLVPKESAQGDNVYDEYLYINDQWELIGSTAIDLTDYVKKTDYPVNDKAGVIKSGGTNYGIVVNPTNGIPTTAPAMPTDIDTKNAGTSSQRYKPITPLNLDYAVKSGITASTITLTDEEAQAARTWMGAIGSDDYAGLGKTGVVSLNSGWGITIGNSTGTLRINGATSTEINTKTNVYRPITPSVLDYAVKTSVTTNTIELTDEEKTTAQAWLGIDTLIGNIETALSEV